MSEIPQGWHSTTLATVAQLKTGPFGSALHKSDYVAGGTPLINPSHIKHGELQPDEAISIDAHALQRLSEYRLQAGDVVMGRRGEMGRCAVVPARAAGWVCGTGSVIVRPSSAILPNYLQRMLSSPGAVERLNGESVGSTMVNLNQGVLLGLPVALPPLMEQQRIAEKLDAVVARVDACRDRLARVTPLLKRFRQSVLAAATSGVLTDDWRVVRRRPAGSWSLTQLQAVAHVGTGSTPLRSNPAFFADTGTPWITSGATSQSVVAAASEFVTDAAIVAHRLKVYPPGTLLVAMYGEGKTRGQVSELGIAATINQACAAIQVDDSQATAAYVKLALMANYLEMRELAEGGNQPNLNLGKLKAFELSLPSLEEQAEIVRRVDTLFAFADRLEARLAKAQAAADRLTPALLAKAFRGELVPQDPADEPAAMLLQRLAASRPVPSAKARRPRVSQFS